MTLTPEQQAALEQLLAHVPPENRRAARAPSRQDMPTARTGDSPAVADALQAWLGLSTGELKTRLEALLAEKDIVEARFLDWSERNPLDAAFEFLTGSAYAFYLAEKEHNPKIKTFVDAFYYIATCASVGYADMFAITQPGRAIAALVMIVGPALTNKALDRPRSVYSEQ